MYGQIVISFLFVVLSLENIAYSSEVITRNEWDAKPAKKIEYFHNPSQYVIIHHSYEPKACYTTEDCKGAMRSMQRYHQQDRGWNDIGYSFAIGGDGKIYEGRGFNVIGAHAIGYNDKSVGICLIGDWRTNKPPTNMLNATKELIEFGVLNNCININYRLIGHVSLSEYSGENLFNEIKTWPNFFISNENTAINEIPNYMATVPESLAIISRQQWGAQPAKLVEHFTGPAPYVIIHHSYEPKACYTTEDCKGAMRSMQRFHQQDRGWNDIGYTFGIGGDGKIYYGRGFNVIGAHAPKYNDKSVGICLIGDWSDNVPPQNMLNAVHDLIDFGVSKGYIAKDFKLLGHRQVRDTECPGDALFSEITSWPHFSPTPNSDTKPNEIATLE